MDDQMIQQLIDEAIGPLEEQLDAYRQENAELRDRISRDEQNQDLLDEIDSLKREVKDIESKYNGQVQKRKALEEKLERLNQDVTSGTQDNMNKDSKISFLEKEVKRVKDLNDRNREDKKNLAEKLREMTKTNQCLQDALNEVTEKGQLLVERQNILMHEIQEKSAEIADKDSEIADLQKRALNVVSKMKKKNSAASVEKAAAQSAAELSEDIQAELLQQKKLNREYRERILNLQTEEGKAQRMTKALEIKQRQIEGLKRQLEDKEEDLVNYKNTAEDLANQLTLYREEKEIYSREYDKKSATMKEKMKTATENAKAIAIKSDNLEQELDDKNKELLEIRQQLKQYENGELGLSSAVDQIKELKAVVTVREKHISDLIEQVNSMDKIINGLTLELGSKFNYDEFIKSIDKRSEEQEKLRIERARKELEEKVRQMRERPNLGAIKIVVNDSKDNQDFDLKTTVEAHSKKNKPKKNKNKKKDKHAHTSTGTFKPNKTVKITPESDDESESSAQEQDSSANTIVNGMHDESIQDEQPMIIDLKDEEVQASEAPLPPQLVAFGDDDERDEWVANLQKKYLEIQKKFKELQKELAELKMNKLHMETEMQNNSSEKRNLESEIEELKKRLQNAVNAYVPPVMQVEQPRPQVVTVKAQEPPKAHLSIPGIFPYFAVPVTPPPKLTLENKPSILLPTAEELRFYQAKEDEKNKKFNDAVKKGAELQARIDDLSSRMNQKDKSIIENQDTISKLEKQLQDQREQFKERLRQLQEETQRNVEARIKELQDVNAVVNGEYGSGSCGSLPEVSKRLKYLNDENQALNNRVKELEEMLESSKKAIDNYRAKVKGYEAEKQELEEKPQKTKIERPLSNPYTQKLQSKNSQLKREITYLKDQLDLAKRTRPAYDTFASESSLTESGKQNDDVDKITTQMNNYKVKYMQAKSQNDEIMNKLEKERENVERLKAMLQKKETALIKMTDKYNQYKHHNEKLTEKYNQYKKQNEKLKAYIEKGGN